MSSPFITATLASFLKVHHAQFSEQSAEVKLREVFGVQVHSNVFVSQLTVPSVLVSDVGFIQFLKTLVFAEESISCDNILIDDDFSLQKIHQIERECGVLFKYNSQTHRLEIRGCKDAMKDFLKCKHKYMRYSISYKSHSSEEWKEIKGELHRLLQDSILRGGNVKLPKNKYGDVWIDHDRMCITDNSLFTRDIRLQSVPIVTMFDQYPELRKYSKFRSVILDGSNVASYHGNSKCFSTEGLVIAINFFRFAGVKVKATIPRMRMSPHFHKLPLIDPNGYLSHLKANDLIVLTDGYEDHMVVDLARAEGAVIISNDTFHDLTQEELAKHIAPMRFPFSCRGNVFAIGRERRSPTFEEVIVLP